MVVKVVSEVRRQLEHVMRRLEPASYLPQSYRTLVTLNYFLFFYALRLIPFLGAPLGFLYASVVDAYYCFECVSLLCLLFPS